MARGAHLNTDEVARPRFRVDLEADHRISRDDFQRIVEGTGNGQQIERRAVVLLGVKTELAKKCDRDMRRHARLYPGAPCTAVTQIVALEPRDHTGVPIRGDVAGQLAIGVGVFDVVAEIVERRREIAHAWGFVQRQTRCRILHHQNLARQHFDGAHTDHIGGSVRHIGHHARRQHRGGRRAGADAVGRRAIFERNDRHAGLLRESAVGGDTARARSVRHVEQLCAGIAQPTHQRIANHCVQGFGMRLRRLQRIRAGDDEARVRMCSTNGLGGRDRRWRVEQEAAIAALPQRREGLCKSVGRHARIGWVRAGNPHGMRQRVRCRIKAVRGIDHHGIECLQQIDGDVRTVEKRQIGLRRTAGDVRKRLAGTGRRRCLRVHSLARREARSQNDECRGAATHHTRRQRTQP